MEAFKSYFPSRLIQIWLYYLAFLFIVCAAWVMMYQVIYLIITTCAAEIPETSMAQSVLGFIENIWNWFPVIAILGGLFAVLVYTHRKESESQIVYR